ncbi:hypothetical protein HDV01_000004 [Terramyces sp. JEL0728]|nr:hypothetical protein HDV01_000004 [Terramyces sp. JEL0728]
MDQTSCKIIIIADSWHITYKAEKSIPYRRQPSKVMKTTRRFKPDAAFTSVAKNTMKCTSRERGFTQSYNFFNSLIDPESKYRPSEEWYQSFENLTPKKNIVSIDNLINQ